MEVVDVHKKNLQRLGYQDFADWVAEANHVYIGRNMSFYTRSQSGQILSMSKSTDMKKA